MRWSQELGDLGVAALVAAGTPLVERWEAIPTNREVQLSRTSGGTIHPYTAEIFTPFS